MFAHRSTYFPLLAASLVAAGCTVGYEEPQGGSDVPSESLSQPVAACVGDDVNYDFNAFAASLAVATANELGRWDATADFEVRNGKLELSQTGQMRCANGCPNVSMLLRLQDDAAASVPNHSPSIYRSKLTGWHGTQVQKLTELVNKMLRLDKGVYRLKARHSGKYLAVDGSSLYDNAGIEQRSSVSNWGADQWRLILEGTKHKLVNVRSGKCLDLSSHSIADGPLVQRSCSTSTSQQFDFAGVDAFYAIRTIYNKALDVEGASGNDDARVLQYTWTGSAMNQQWALEPVGTGHIKPEAVATAVYSLTMRHSGKTLGVADGSMSDGALINQGTYVASNDRFHWYVIRNGDRYQFVNRRSGKCMGLAADHGGSRIVQQTCDGNNSGQTFHLTPTGDGYQVGYSKFGSTMVIENANTAEGAFLTQGMKEWNNHRMFQLKPILAGEPHRLTYAYRTADATCGEYNYWYNIVKPNHQGLEAPQDTWVQLIFAGGKQSPTGADVNPFIAQQMQGNLVAIDPTAGTIQDDTSTSGSCSSTCAKYSLTNIAGQCCVCNGYTKKLVRSSFSIYAYTCTG